MAKSTKKASPQERRLHQRYGGFAGNEMANPGVNNTLLALQPGDSMVTTEKVTAGYFTGNLGIASGTNLFTGSSKGTSNDAYYKDITLNHATGSVQWTATYGHVNSSGSLSFTDQPGAAKYVYGQLANILLSESEQTGGFFIRTLETAYASTQDEYVYALIANRTNMKDKLNKKNWSIVFSGSNTAGINGGSGSMIHLTDDSATRQAVATPAGPRYNIISGSLGTAAVSQSATVRTYGWFYPDIGVLLFSGTALSASAPGSGSCPGGPTNDLYTAGYENFAVCNGFAPSLATDADQRNSLRLTNALRNSGSMQFRNEQIQISRHYFVRATAPNFNFSNNASFTSGSNNTLRWEYMQGNPQVFITGVGLFDGAGNMVAVAKLSTPIQKNFQSEATIKVKLTY